MVSAFMDGWAAAVRGSQRKPQAAGRARAAPAPCPTCAAASAHANRHLISTPSPVPTLQGLTSLAASFIAFLVYFPPWGGMLPAPRCGACCAPATEEEYYA